MKDALIGKGSITLEIVIALAVLSLSLAAAAVLAFGEQSTLLQMRGQSEALSLARTSLAAARRTAEENQMALASTSASSAGGIFYTTTLSLHALSPCLFFATSSVSFEASPHRAAVNTLAALIAAPAMLRALGGDCPVELPHGDWRAPRSISSVGVGVPAADADALQKYVYVALASSSPNAPDMAVYFYDGAALRLASAFSDGDPFAAVDAAGAYVFAAAASTTKQLRVIDVTNSNAPREIAALAISNVAGDHPQGHALYFYNHAVYLGFMRTAGPEFDLVDVSNPSQPRLIGSREMDHDVNAIAAQGDFAYLALTTSDANDDELAVLNISQPPAILPRFKRGVADPWGFDAPGTEDATALYLLGNTLYLGRQKGSAAEPNFIVLNVSSSTHPASCAACSYNIKGASVRTISVVGALAFVATNKGVVILNVANPAAISEVASLSVPGGAAAADYDNGALYAAAKDGTVRAYTSI